MPRLILLFPILFPVTIKNSHNAAVTDNKSSNVLKYITWGLFMIHKCEIVLGCCEDGLLFSKEVDFSFDLIKIIDVKAR